MIPSSSAPPGVVPSFVPSDLVTSLVGLVDVDDGTAGDPHLRIRYRSLGTAAPSLVEFAVVGGRLVAADGADFVHDVAFGSRPSRPLLHSFRETGLLLRRAGAPDEVWTRPEIRRQAREAASSIESAIDEAFRRSLAPALPALAEPILDAFRHVAEFDLGVFQRMLDSPHPDRLTAFMRRHVLAAVQILRVPAAFQVVEDGGDDLAAFRLARASIRKNSQSRSIRRSGHFLAQWSIRCSSALAD